MNYTVGSLFSGIGGLDLAAHWAGFTTSWFVEREPFCQRILAKHWPNTPIHGDVFECHDLPHVDVIVGGFPCQPFSVAGNRKGADDERYLLPEMLRIIREVKPYVVLFENVPGFPQLNDGAEFKYLLRTLAEMGFDAEWGHLRASDSGAPHQRERWFCVAYTQGVSRSRGLGQRNDQRSWSNDTRERIGLRAVATVGSEVVANAVSDGDVNGGEGRALHHRNGDSSQEERRRIIQQHGVITSSEIVGNIEGIRCQRHTARQGQNRLQQGRASELMRGSVGSTQPRLRRVVDGLPSGLDFVGWPARPGEDQYAYEPSRVTTTKTPDRAARLKALGNAVVPQVAYPLFAAIHEWLTAQDAERIA